MCLLKKSHAQCQGKTSCQGSGAATAEILLPPALSLLLAQHGKRNMKQFIYTLHAGKGDLTSALPAVAAKKAHAKGREGSTPPSWLHHSLLSQFPLLQSRMPNTSPFLEPSDTEPVPPMSKAQPQWFLNSPTPEEHSDRYFMHWKNKRDHKTM